MTCTCAVAGLYLGLLLLFSWIRANYTAVSPSAHTAVNQHVRRRAGCHVKSGDNLANIVYELCPWQSQTCSSIHLFSYPLCILIGQRQEIQPGQVACLSQVTYTSSHLGTIVYKQPKHVCFCTVGGKPTRIEGEVATATQTVQPTLGHDNDSTKSKQTLCQAVCLESTLINWMPSEGHASTYSFTDSLGLPAAVCAL